MQNAAMFDWGDLRVFLAVARSGSTLAAGRMLRVSQTTAARRVAALEAALGQPLFDRRQAGYRLTPAGAELMPSAEAVEAAVHGFEEVAQGRARQQSGTVRITTADIYAMHIVAPRLGEFADRHPDIRLELLATDALLDLSKGEADVAVRGGKRPIDPALVGRRIARDRWTVYCSRGYAWAHGVLDELDDLKRHNIVGGGGDSVWPQYRAWLAAHGLLDRVTSMQSSASGLMAAVKGGAGVAILPSLVASRDPELVEMITPGEDVSTEIWLLTHSRLRHQPRIRTVMDWLAGLV
jgi:DNA-binding transcriptional LysR family regulator